MRSSYDLSKLSRLSSPDVFGLSLMSMLAVLRSSSTIRDSMSSISLVDAVDGGTVNPFSSMSIIFEHRRASGPFNESRNILATFMHVSNDTTYSLARSIVMSKSVSSPSYKHQSRRGCRLYSNGSVVDSVGSSDSANVLGLGLGLVRVRMYGIAMNVPIYIGMFIGLKNNKADVASKSRV